MFFARSQFLVAVWLLHRLAAAEGAEDHIRPFYSRPDLKAPSLNVSLGNSRVVEEYLFISPYFNAPNKPDGGPYIFDQQGSDFDLAQDLIWSGVDAAGGAGATDVQGLHACDYQEKQHLCYWQGLQRGMHGTGLGVIMNEHYRIVKTVQGGSATASTDLHEFRLTTKNTALITIYNPRFHSGLWILDSVFQEIDLDDNRVIFEWRSLDYIDPAESHVPVDGFALVGDGSSADRSWDYFHINSIDKNQDGDYLISARHCDAIFKISYRDGSIIWRLHGDNSSFRLSDFTFRRQHHARFVEDTSNRSVISLFNNDNDGFIANGPTSFGMVLEIDHHSQVATQTAEYGATLQDGVIAKGMGNMEHLADDNMLVNWGTDSAMAEFLPNGTAVWHATIGWKSFNYRAHKSAWVGKPVQPPALWTYRQRAKSPILLYASWNGATEVHRWRFYVSASQMGPYKLIGAEVKKSFETTYESSVYGSWAFVEALDVQNVSLRNSSKVETYMPHSDVAASCGIRECFTAPILSQSNEQTNSWASHTSGDSGSDSCKWAAVGGWSFWRWVEMFLEIIGMAACVGGTSFFLYRTQSSKASYKPLSNNEI